MMSLQTSINFIFGLILNQSLRSDMAWKTPKLLKQRLNMSNLDLEKIQALGLDKFKHYFSMKPCLHRFPDKMAKYIFESSYLIIEKFDGDPRNIWDNKNTEEIFQNFIMVPGIGEHKSRLGLVILDNLESSIKLSEIYYTYVCNKCPQLLNSIDDILKNIIE